MSKPAVVDENFRRYILAFADDEHLMGQRHTEWIGVAPFLEEDLAFASIGQDELGHAAMLYELLTDDIDGLALRRSADEYLSCHVVEDPCTDWADALVRHWLYDAAEELRWDALRRSTVVPLAEAAAVALRDEQFHRRHADALLDAIAEDPEANARVAAAAHRLVPLSLGLFDPPAGEQAVLDAGVANASMASLVDAWRERVDHRLGPIPWDELTPPSQHARTTRSGHFAAVYADMREVILVDPAATW